MTFSIDKDVPFPGPRFPLADMDVGDSFLIPDSGFGVEMAAGRRQTFSLLHVEQQTHHPYMRLEEREVEGGVRVWRLPPEGPVQHGIGWAVKQLLNGFRVARAGWNGKNMWLVRIPPGGPSSQGDDITFEWQEFVAMKTAQDTVVPWLCSQSDLLATDWAIVT